LLGFRPADPQHPAATTTQQQSEGAAPGLGTLAAYLGHRQIANTARYTKMDAKRFDGFRQD
jgi:hypothetical protein